MRQVKALLRLWRTQARHSTVKMRGTASEVTTRGVAFWHRSANWEWYTVLFLGGVALIAVNEASVGLVLVLLGFVSLDSKLWHSQRRIVTKVFGTIGVGVLILMAATGTVAYMEERPWSNVPVFFKRFVFLKTLADRRPTSLTPPAYPPNLSVFVKTEVPVQPVAATAPMPDIGMEFVNPEDVSFRMVNLSSKAVVRDPKYVLILMDLDGHETTYSNGQTMPDILPIPASVASGDFLRPNQKYLPRPIVSTFPAVKQLVKPHDRVFGTAVVSCPGCIKDRRYVVFFKNGEGGWYCESTTMPETNHLIPITSDADLEKIAPSKNRILIKPAR
jgi:hypothetical protein